MKTLWINLILATFLAVGSIYPSMAQTPEQIYQKGLMKEEGEGALLDAIDLFNQVADNSNADISLQAKALLHIGMCYEKLGKDEATKAYQRLVNNFPGQKNEVAIARERLSRLILLTDKKDREPLTPKFTKIKIPTKLSWNVALSPDGKDLALVSDKKLWKMPLSGNLGPEFPGTPVQLNTGDIEVEWTGLSWSGDGKWIAFNDEPKKDENVKSVGKQSIYLVSSIGGNPQKVLENFRDVRTVNYRISLSSDGKKLAYTNVENTEQHIYATQVIGGSPKQLVDIQAREPVFSPDGKWIAYVEDKNLRRSGGDLWILPIAGGDPKLIAKAGMASSPVWSPDGKMIAFLDYNKNKQVNLVHLLKSGDVEGEVTRIEAPSGTGNITLLAGWTPDNKIGMLVSTKREFAIYTLPSKGGQAAMVLNDNNWIYQPRWAHDGNQIYYTTSTGEDGKQGLLSRFATVSVNGGLGKPFPFSTNHDGDTIRTIIYQAGNRLSPDGKMLISSAWTPKDHNPLNPNFPNYKIWKLPVDGGEPLQLTRKSGNYADLCPCWSPSGDKVAFVRVLIKKGGSEDYDEASIFIIDSSGKESEILISTTDKYIFSTSWSPDGKRIAYLSKVKEDPNGGYLNIIDLESGESRIVGQIKGANVNTELAWSPDSRQIAYNGEKIHVINIDDGSIMNIETNLLDIIIYHIDWSADGERFVFGGIKIPKSEFWFLEDFLPLEKLAQNKEPNITAPQLMFKKIWNESDTELGGAPSPDGRFLSYVDWETGDLAIYEIETGEKRRLTNKGSWDESKEFALMSRWSPDGKQIVYDWKNENDFCDLRIIGLDGSKPRILYSNKDVKWTYTFDWSPDGKQILAYLDRKNGNDMIGQIVLISLVDGSERILKTSAITKTGQAWPENMCFSPDGRYIIYDFPQKAGSLERDIFMLSTSGNQEISLVEHPSHDELFGYTPDGKIIIFESDRNGTFGLWSQQIAEGNPFGKSELVRSDMGSIKPLGFTKNGSFFYGNSKKNIEMYIAEFHPETGEILSPPKKIVTRFGGYNQTPCYSPDGKYMAYISKRAPLTNFPDYTIGQLGGNVLCIKSLETGNEREFFPELDRFIHPCWSPDGRSVIVLEREKSGSNKIDLQTGNVTLVANDDNIGPQPTEFSHDGKTIFYMQYDKKAKLYEIIVRDIESETEKKIYQSDGSLHIRLSPDGKWLAVQSYFIGGNLESKEKIPRMFIISSAGGEPLELCRFEEGIDLRAGGPFTWTPDGKYILYTMKSPKKENGKCDLYRISVQGGKPEKLEMEMSGFINNLSVHPDGRHIAFSVTEQSNAEIWVMQNLVQELDKIYRMKE